MEQKEFSFALIGSDSDKLMREIFSIRYQVYCKERGFIRKADYPSRTESDKYDAYSLHFIARFNNELVGTSRLILNNPHGFLVEEKAGDKLRIDLSYIDRDKIAEISRVAISKVYKNKLRKEIRKRHHDLGSRTKFRDHLKPVRPLAFGLYRSMYQESKRRGVIYWLALMKTSLWTLLRSHNLIFHQIGDSVDYYGKVEPYICNLEELEAVLFRRSPKLLDFFTDGLEEEYKPNTRLFCPASDSFGLEKNNA